MFRQCFWLTINNVVPLPLFSLQRNLQCNTSQQHTFRDSIADGSAKYSYYTFSICCTVISDFPEDVDRGKERLLTYQSWDKKFGDFINELYPPVGKNT